MAGVVLDASAILAVLNAEPGAEKVVPVLGAALVGTVNYAEVIGKLVERGVDYEQANAALRSLALTIVDFDIGLSRRTGALRGETAKLDLSLGDRACLSLAEREGATVYTADRNWAGALATVEIHIIR
jgi:ribonuclease VapC